MNHDLVALLFLLTGDRSKTRVKILVRQKGEWQARWLPFSQFQLLVRMIIARDKSQNGSWTGYMPMTKRNAWSLRGQIGQRDWIEVAGGRKTEDDELDYRLAYTPRGKVGRFANLEELVGGIISPDHYAKLVEICTLCEVQELECQPVS